MKLLSSTSSSASSITSFDENMCNSRNAAAGCLVGVLRRLVCSSSLPTYPSDHTIESSSMGCASDQTLKDEESTQISAAPPGIVARLMGLESMPDKNFARTKMIPGSITRSRSMNSVDYYWLRCDQMQARHRRVKPSLSFREMPTYLELENEDFFILSFESGGHESKKSRTKAKKSEMGNGEFKKKSREECKSKENRTEKVREKKNKEDQGTNKKISAEKENLRRRVSDKPSYTVENDCKVKDSTKILRPTKNSQAKLQGASEIVKPLKPIIRKEVCGEEKSRKKKTSHSAFKKIVPECGSEDSSPVSVLDFDEFLADLKVPVSEEDPKLMGSNSRRKLSPELENFEQATPCNSGSLISEDQETKTTEGKRVGSRKKDWQGHEYLDMWCEIQKLTQEEMMESNWICSEMCKLEDFKDISATFGVQILDQLLNEAVEQLVRPSVKIFDL